MSSTIPLPHANSFVIGTALNKHTHRNWFAHVDPDAYQLKKPTRPGLGRHALALVPLSCTTNDRFVALLGTYSRPAQFIQHALYENSKSGIKQKQLIRDQKNSHHFAGAYCGGAGIRGSGREEEIQLLKGGDRETRGGSGR